MGRIFSVSFVYGLILSSLVENRTNTQQGTWKNNLAAFLSLVLAFTHSLPVEEIQAEHAV